MSMFLALHFCSALHGVVRGGADFVHVRLCCRIFGGLHISSSKIKSLKNVNPSNLTNTVTHVNRADDETRHIPSGPQP